MTEQALAKKMLYRSAPLSTTRGPESFAAGLRIKLASQPLQLLFLLLERPGELLTRRRSPGSCGRTEPSSTMNMA